MVGGYPFGDISPPLSSFLGLVERKHEGINNSRLSPVQAGSSCCLILEQITNQMISVDLSEPSDSSTAQTYVPVI